MRYSVILLSFLTTIAKKLPPPDKTLPVCEDPPCYRKKIRTEIIIDNSLWDSLKYRDPSGDPSQFIILQLENMFEDVNNLLKNLDNGGYMVDFDHNITKLEDSGIRLKDTYVDRLDNNITKKFDKNKIHSHTFAFQEAVQDLPDRFSVDLRILVIPYSGYGPTIGTAEETCICNPNWFGCVAVFAIEFENDWSYHQTIFAHEIGHTIGMDLHDDEFYTYNPGNKLIMWSGIGRQADIWSPEARRRINSQNNSCLAVEQSRPSSATLSTTSLRSLSSIEASSKDSSSSKETSVESGLKVDDDDNDDDDDDDGHDGQSGLKVGILGILLCMFFQAKIQTFVF